MFLYSHTKTTQAERYYFNGRRFLFALLLAVLFIFLGSVEQIISYAVFLLILVETVPVLVKDILARSRGKKVRVVSEGGLFWSKTHKSYLEIER